MIAVCGLFVAIAFTCVCAHETSCAVDAAASTGSVLIQRDASVSNANLEIAVVEADADWQSGTATFYGDGGSGGACGGSELGDYGTGQSWIDGLYAATSSSMWCGSSGGSCGSTHAPDCGRCYEVKCVGTDTNTDGYEPCSEATVKVAVTDECPGGSALLEVNQTNLVAGHCGGSVQHFDLSTKAFKIIGSERAGAIKIEYRRVSCSALGNLKLRFHGTRWHFKVAPWDVNGPGTLSNFEVKNAHLGSWTTLKPSYGGFWLSDTDINDGPYDFRLTADDGQVILYSLETTIASVSGTVLDTDKQFQGGSDPSLPPSPSSPPTSSPTSLPTSLPTSIPMPPTSSPTSLPTSVPTSAPTLAPTALPTTTQSPPMTGVGKQCASPWAQCGGKGYSGPTCCKEGYQCVFDNDWWSMCKPSTATPHAMLEVRTRVQKGTSHDVAASKSEFVRIDCTSQGLEDEVAKACDHCKSMESQGIAIDHCLQCGWECRILVAEAFTTCHVDCLANRGQASANVDAIEEQFLDEDLADAKDSSLLSTASGRWWR